jgi:CRISPR-associated protein Cas2
MSKKKQPAIKPAGAGEKQFIVVSYDITDDKRRVKVMKQMENFGRRVQYSVFECDLKPEQIKTLKQRLKPLLKKREDSVRFYYMSEGDVKRIESLAGEGVARDPVTYIV